MTMCEMQIHLQASWPRGTQRRSWNLA